MQTGFRLRASAQRMRSLWAHSPIPWSRYESMHGCAGLGNDIALSQQSVTWDYSNLNFAQRMVIGNSPFVSKTSEEKFQWEMVMTPESCVIIF
jgi:hypothetical protein